MCISLGKLNSEKDFMLGNARMSEASKLVSLGIRGKSLKKKVYMIMLKYIVNISVRSS